MMAESHETPEDRPVPQHDKRRRELEPALASFAHQAILAYDALKLNAVRGEEIGEDSPGLQPEIFELGGRAVGSMVKVRFNGTRNLSIYHNHTRTNILSYDWQFVRREHAEDRHVETTKITKFPAWVEGYDDVFEFEVSRRRLVVEAGQELPVSEQCGPNNNYAGAETYIAGFKTDVDLAVRLFGA